MKRRLDRCNKCGEPLRAGICSDEVDCLLDRTFGRLPLKAPTSAGRTRIGRMVLRANGIGEHDPINLAEMLYGDVVFERAPR